MGLFCIHFLFSFLQISFDNKSSGSLRDGTIGEMAQYVKSDSRSSCERKIDVREKVTKWQDLREWQD